MLWPARTNPVLLVTVSSIHAVAHVSVHYAVCCALQVRIALQVFAAHSYVTSSQLAHILTSIGYAQVWESVGIGDV